MKAPGEQFGSKAKVYSGRPEWPESVYTLMLAKAGFNPIDGQGMKKLVAVDVGAGTGKTTFPLADFGCTVIAVEPNKEMREKLTALKEAGGYSNVIVTDGDAFNLKIPDRFEGKVDLFYSGNSPHWWSSRMNGNVPDSEEKAVAAWRRYAKPDAKAAIMFLRTLEIDPHVKKLREILAQNFNRIAHVPTEFTATRLFSAEAYRDYFNRKGGKVEMTETYGNYEFKLRDFDHYKDWLLSFSYMPNDAFHSEEAARELSDFYAESAKRNGGTASVMQGLRLYTGPLRHLP